MPLLVLWQIVTLPEHGVAVLAGVLVAVLVMLGIMVDVRVVVAPVVAVPVAISVAVRVAVLAGGDGVKVRVAVFVITDVGEGVTQGSL